MSPFGLARGKDGSLYGATVVSGSGHQSAIESAESVQDRFSPGGVRRAGRFQFKDRAFVLASAGGRAIDYSVLAKHQRSPRVGCIGGGSREIVKSIERGGRRLRHAAAGEQRCGDHRS